MKVVPILLSLALPLSGQGVHWENNLEDALRRAQAEHKVIFLDLWAEWCGPCQALREHVFPSAEGQAALQRVVPLSVMVESRDGTPTVEGQALAKRFGLKAFPSLFILDAQGNLLRRHLGYLQPEAFAQFVRGY